ncbi:GspE/PulE family protein [Desulforamulus hydrothermalis]|uniref:General secretory pathway component, cryptic n=1 Tax=Desulforamulus hydrothermalis Lam5 = DSM 18033 TaxID=1121428 RepID=K8E071_9FIRM|nr:GspE/PulE family protein [Desulforamulus hydrothermalis]CCO08867.1 general secretory pathway component, cryptic [Desulforamulus hydrothermalis Lam5 = DSM 18033]SHG73581.1 type II secretion system protein E (GspE) [Desulforamulus hydrothermalis Lam5 = DSM 18033]
MLNQSPPKMIGDILAEQGIITRSQLEEALQKQQRSQEPLGRVLVGLGYVTEHQLVEALAAQYQFVERDIRQTVDLPNHNLIRESSGEEASVIGLVQHILQKAVRLGASDIHFEPQETGFRVRLRMDGILRPLLNLPVNMQAAVVSRIKIMSDLDIAEKRLPQDGRLPLSTGSQKYDLRVSTMPTAYGEKVVIRLLDTGAVRQYRLEQLDFSPHNLARLKHCLRAAYGMILITGPTGSGKTTTLYTVLNELNNEQRNLSTIEDPIEYRLEGVNQTQVNTKAGMSFAVGLRALLRQDPDIIMVGEIRDKETAEIAVKAAGTGHLVLSTLHTNDAVGAVDRFIHMGIEPFQVASSVLGVVAQRLVRRLCPYCKQPYRVVADSLEGYFAGVLPGQEAVYYRPVGCRRCYHSGYRGRLAIHEILLLSRRLRTLLLNRATADELLAAAGQEGMQTLQTDGLTKAKQGLTSLPEVMRATYFQAESFFDTTVLQKM